MRYQPRKHQNQFRLFFINILLISLVSGYSAEAQPGYTKHVQAELISENVSIQPGEPFWVALKLEMDEDWHINWQNPGDFGLAPTIDWKLPEGFTAGEIQWPVPERLDFPPFVGYGYEGQTILSVKITPPKNLEPGAKIELKANADWIVCGEVCVPGGDKLSLGLTVSQSSLASDKKIALLFETFRNNAPQTDKSYKISSELTEKFLIIKVRNSSQNSRIDNLLLFPDFNGLIKNASSQKLSKDESGYILKIERDPMGVDPPERLKGILVVRNKTASKTIKANVKFDVELSKI